MLKLSDRILIDDIILILLEFKEKLDGEQLGNWKKQMFSEMMTSFDFEVFVSDFFRNSTCRFQNCDTKNS